ncbi:MAG: RHS repeat-associated core domain-containing protein [Thermoguttaceae bacterium]|nr:RHS repeat-associated core domain-containing protein [Thermoguttaceae bacterium]
MKTFHRPKFRPYRSTLPHRRDRGRYCFFSGTEHERRRMVCIGGNYDAVGHQTAFPLTLNGRSDRTISTEYDHLGNATSIRQHGNAVDEIFAEFEHNANGLLTSVRRYEKDDDTINEIANSLYEYNANSAVTSITHNDSNGSQIVKHSYTYDETNNIVEYLNSIDGNTEYNYDFLGQLISADYANGSIADETYTYDENGNRITANGSNYTTGDNNELTSDGTWTYTYDAEGNRISKTNAANTERELYTWDYRNRLTTVTKQTYDTLTNEWTTVQIVEYAYDYNNIWIRKTLDTNGDGIADSKTIFIPENYQTTVQIDNNTVTHHYLWTPNQQDKLLTDTTASGILWALTDHLETIRDVLDGNSSTHLIYDAFGNLISGTNPILFGYTGKAFDPDTALQNNINRWYDSTVGRWLSTDPMGFNGSDTNLYRYVGNRTIDSCDVMGLQIQNPFKNVKEQPRKIFENELGRIKSGIDQIQAEIEKIKNNIKKELPGYCSECDDRVQLNQIHMTSSLTATVKNKVKANKLKIINYSPKTAIVTDLAEKISSQLERGLYWTDSVDYRIQSKSYECNQSHIIKKFSGVLSRIPVTFQFSLALLNDNKTIDFYKPEYVPLIYGTPLATMDVELEFFCTIAYEIDVYHCC